MCVTLHDLNLHFINGWSWYLFMCLFALRVSSLVKCLPCLYPFSNWIVCLCTVEVWESFIFSRYKSFVKYVGCKYFSQSRSSLFILLGSSSTEQTFLISMKSFFLTLFLLWIMLLVWHLTTGLQTSGPPQITFIGFKTLWKSVMPDN